MSKLKPSYSIKKQILEGTAKFSPFDKTGHLTFLKFDQIVFDTYTGDVSFKFERETVLTYDAKQDGYEKGVILTLDCLEGRVRCDFQICPQNRN